MWIRSGFVDIESNHVSPFYYGLPEPSLRYDAHQEVMKGTF